MRTLLVLALIAVIGWAGWKLLSHTNTNNSVALSSSSPTATVPGLGGQGPEPSGYVDTGTTGAAYSEPTATPTPTVRTSTTVRHTTTVTPRRTATPVARTSVTPSPVPSNSTSPSPSASSNPVLTYRNIQGINGFGETGTLAISSTDNNQTQINVNLSNGPTSGSQPAYIYSGTSCQASNSIAYQLNPVMNGTSMTILPISASQFVNRSSLWLVVTSPDNGTRVACVGI